MKKAKILGLLMLMLVVLLISSCAPRTDQREITVTVTPKEETQETVTVEPIIEEEEETSESIVEEIIEEETTEDEDEEEETQEEDDEPEQSTETGTVLTYDTTVWPTISTSLSDGFGPRVKNSEGDRFDFHRGIDIQGDRNDPIYSIADGEVVRTYVEGGGEGFSSGGNVVIIEHQMDEPFEFQGESITTYYSLYLHMESFNVEEDDIIQIGQQIGEMGDSGEGTNTVHLHFEARVGCRLSYDYQIDNPGNSCEDVFDDPTDPHVNPFLFLDYENDNDLEFEVTDESPLTVVVKTPRSELDFNRIEVESVDGDKTIDFNERTGMNSDDRDDDDYDGVRTIIEDDFDTSSDFYEVMFEFSDLTSFESIKVFDIWGNAIVLS